MYASALRLRTCWASSGAAPPSSLATSHCAPGAGGALQMPGGAAVRVLCLAARAPTQDKSGNLHYLQFSGSYCLRIPSGSPA